MRNKYAVPGQHADNIADFLNRRRQQRSICLNILKEVWTLIEPCLGIDGSRYLNPPYLLRERRPSRLRRG